MLAATVLTAALAGSSLPPEVVRGARRAEAAFVRLSIAFGRDPEAIPGQERPGRAALADRLYENKMTLSWYGIVVSESGEILCADPCMPLERFRNVRAAYSDGRKLELRLKSIFVDYNALTFVPVDRKGRDFKRVSFSSPALSPGELFWRVEMVTVGADPYLQVVPERADLLPFGGGGDWRALFGLTTGNSPFSGCLLLNRKGEPFGYLVDYDLWDGPGGLTTYNPRALQSGRRLSWEEYKACCKRLAEKVRRSLRRIRIFLRNVKEEDEEGSRIFRFGDRREEERKVLTLYGLSVGGGRFLVLVDLPRRAIKQITRILVEQGGEEREAPYIGCFAQWGALLVGGAEGVPAYPIDAGAAPVRGRLFLVHRVAERFGGLYQRTDYNRYFNTKKGPGDREIIQPLKEIKGPAYLFDTEGKLLGFHLAWKDPSKPGERRSLPQVVSTASFAPLLKNPGEHFDPLAKPEAKPERERPVWLGVEFQRVNRNLMELLGLLDRTKEGSIGLLVCHVYRSSPARRLGIRPGDILLSVRKVEEDRPIEFVARRADRWSSSWSWMYGRSTSGDRLWRSRRNYLTEILTKIGAGSEVELIYLHRENGTYRKRTARLVLEKGPEDYDTTERRKIKSLGITVRNLTYEVREVLRLKEDFPGVVISAVERGGKADVRRLAPYEIITHVDNAPVKDVEEFERAVNEALKQKKKQIFLRIWTIGEGRVVSIDLQSP